MTSKRAGHVIPRQPGPGSMLPVSTPLTLGTCTGYASGWQPYTRHPSLLRPSGGSHHSPQAPRPHTPPGPGCPTWHHLSSRRRPTRALSAPRVAGTTSHQQCRGDEPRSFPAPGKLDTPRAKVWLRARAKSGDLAGLSSEKASTRQQGVSTPRGHLAPRPLRTTWMKKPM